MLEAVPVDGGAVALNAALANMAITEK